MVGMSHLYVNSHLNSCLRKKSPRMYCFYSKIIAQQIISSTRLENYRTDNRTQSGQELNVFNESVFTSWTYFFCSRDNFGIVSLGSLYQEGKWTVVRTEHLISDGAVSELWHKFLGDKDVVDTPTDVPG